MELEPRSSRARGAHKFRTSSHSRPRRRRKMSADAVYMAKLAEQAERYDEMVEYMKKVAMEKPAADDLSLEERNLLSVAYKNVVGARRASLRIIGSIEAKEQQKADGEKAGLVSAYKSKVSTELDSICTDILQLLDNNLISDSLSPEPKVFYFKMKADYYRYLAEFAQGDAKASHAGAAQEVSFRRPAEWPNRLDSNHVSRSHRRTRRPPTPRLACPRPPRSASAWR